MNKVNKKIEKMEVDTFLEEYKIAKRIFKEYKKNFVELKEKIKNEKKSVN